MTTRITDGTGAYDLGYVDAPLAQAPNGSLRVTPSATPAGTNLIGSVTPRAAPLTGTNRSTGSTNPVSTPMAANTSRVGWKVQNQSTGAGEDMFINFFGAASSSAGSGSYKISPGQILASEPGFCETGAMSVLCPAGNRNITIIEF